MSKLSVQQEVIVRLAAHGLTNKEIALRLKIGVRAVETQFVRMRKKLETSNKTETIAEAMQLLHEQVSQARESQSPRPSLSLVFTPNLSEEEILSFLKATADLYRACGGLGLVIDFAEEELRSREPAHV